MIKAAVVGIGWWGKHILDWMRESPQLRIVAGVDPNPGVRSFLTDLGIDYYATLDAVLPRPEIELMILVTPHALHTEQILKCAAAGKHVFCEKPLALNRGDAQRSIDACLRAGVKLGIGHERRFEPAMESLRSLMHSGALGTFLHAEANFSHDKLVGVPAGDWRGPKIESAEAGMTGMGVHMTDLLIDLVGPVREVEGRAHFFRPGEEMGAVIATVMRFVNGGVAYLNVTTITALYMRLAVFGSKGWAEVRNFAHPDSPGTAELEVNYRDGTSRSFNFSQGAGDAVRSNLNSFAESLQGGPAYRFSDSQLVENVAVLESILLSTQRGSTESVRGGP